MTPEIKTKWVEALRSGKYKQGFLHLKHSNMKKEVSYCCLGVLCEVLNAPVTMKGNFYFFKTGDFISQYSISKKILPDFVQTILAGFNDSQRKSFNEIAGWIEENL